MVTLEKKRILEIDENNLANQNAIKSRRIDERVSSDSNYNVKTEDIVTDNVKVNEVPYSAIDPLSGCLSLFYDHTCITPGVWAERGIRKFMEDTHIVCLSMLKSLSSSKPHMEFSEKLDGAVFGVFDGHGGRQTSTFLKENIISELASEAVKLFGVPSDDFLYSDKDIQKCLRATFASLDSRIASELPSCKDGSTVILAFLPFCQQEPRHIYIACLGDAAAYLGRTIDGVCHAIPLSETHKPWIIKEKERILKNGGTVESGRVNGLLELSRSLGDIPLKKYGISCVPTLMKCAIDPTQDECILLGCDGFWLNWTAIEAFHKTREFILKDKRRLMSQTQQKEISDPKEICQQLVEHVLVEKKSQDNVSLILLQIRKIQ